MEGALMRDVAVGDLTLGIPFWTFLDRIHDVVPQHDLWVGLIKALVRSTDLGKVKAAMAGWIDTPGRDIRATLLAWATDYVAAMLGAKRAGASRLAVLGAAIGTVLGVFTGLLGLVFMPLAGAAIGELVAVRNASRAAKVGVSTWIGLLLGTLAKVVLTFMMVGFFVAALLIR
jgi:uncharacterized protein YqgC (DUF456 family)